MQKLFLLYVRYPRIAIRRVLCLSKYLLLQALTDDEALVRGHVAWALGQIGGIDAKRALENRVAIEKDKWVTEEVSKVYFYFDRIFCATVNRYY